MTKVRLTKKFSFEMAHALEGYDGACKHIHGHSYHMFVTVIGSPNEDINNPKCGMVMDFSVLKKIVNTTVIEKYDHSFVCRKSQKRESLLNDITEEFEKVILTDYQPTCENMISRIAKEISLNLPEGTFLHHIKLHETENSFAEWFASDNI
ncbi:MAG: 6-carboxytetrahydropterin synthase [Bacteroidetes bacterium]|nr:6-carboxytetrahydropterin synthase [Bacteroidota bacterium]